MSPLCRTCLISDASRSWFPNRPCPALKLRVQFKSTPAAVISTTDSGTFDTSVTVSGGISPPITGNPAVLCLFSPSGAP